MSSEDTTSVIVVGVDGSENSCDALRWAVDEARIRGATLRAVYAWGYPYAGAMDVVMAYPDLATLTTGAAAKLESVLQAVVEDDVQRAAIQRVVVEGGGAECLIAQSRSARLLVVGARGHGGFLGLLLGSVSMQCVHHGECPVVVVPRGAADVTSSSGPRGTSG